jgi:hypothetical protein
VKAPEPEFNVMRELRRTGARVITSADVEWFQWRPRPETIVINAAAGAHLRRSTTALALAHRALGHWGNTLRQDIEARGLVARWLISDRQLDTARQFADVVGIDQVAAALRVTPNVVRIRLGLPCQCLTNIDVFRGATCECRRGSGLARTRRNTSHLTNGICSRPVDGRGSDRAARPHGPLAVRETVVGALE